VRVAGLRSVRIYAAADGGAAQVVGQVAAAGTARVHLAAGHTYDLYSVAVDRAGNEEAPPPKPDATLTVRPA
jgi:predicted phage tail protein